MKKSTLPISFAIVALLILGCPSIHNKTSIAIIDITGATNLAVAKQGTATRGSQSNGTDKLQFIKELPNGTREVIETRTADGRVVPDANPPSVIKSINEEYVILAYDHSYNSYYDYDYSSSMYGCYLVHKDSGAVYIIVDEEQGDPDMMWALTEDSNAVIFSSDASNNIYYSYQSYNYGYENEGVHKIDVSDPHNITLTTNYVPSSLHPSQFTVDKDGNVSWYNGTLYLKPHNEEIRYATNERLEGFEDFEENEIPGIPRITFTLGDTEYGLAFSQTPYNEGMFNDNITAIFTKRTIDWNTGEATYTYDKQLAADGEWYWDWSYDTDSTVNQFSDCVLIQTERYGDGFNIIAKLNTMGELEVFLSDFSYGYEQPIYRSPYLYKYSGYAEEVWRYNIHTQESTHIPLDTEYKISDIDEDSIEIFHDGTIVCEGTLQPSGNKGILTLRLDEQGTYQRSYDDKGSSSYTMILEKIN